MSKANQNERDNLQTATEALVNMSVPAGPEVEIEQELLRKISESNLPSSFAGVLAMNRKLSLVASVLLCVIVGWLLLNMGASPNQAFAQMLEKIQVIRTASFNLKVYMQGQDAVEIKTTLLEPSWMKQEMNVQGNEVVHVFNMREGRVMSLNRQEKKASIIGISGVDEHNKKSNIIEDFRNMDTETCVFIKRESLNGIEALKYKLDREGEYYCVWLHSETNLPVKIEMQDVADPDKASARLVMTDFVWDIALDENTFSFVPPEGYEIQKQEVQVGGSSRDNFVKMISFAVRLNNDQFLDEFNMMSLVSAIQRNLMNLDGSEKERELSAKQKLAYALEMPEIVEMNLTQRMELGGKLAQVFGQGAAFYEVLQKTHHWHYQGKGVRLGQEDEIVAYWYLKNDSSEARDARKASVLYGDLRIEDIPLEDFPVGTKQ